MGWKAESPRPLRGQIAVVTVSHPDRLMLLGTDHGEYGRAELADLPPATACALTAGADSASPGLAFKGDPSVPNEDGLLVVDDGRHALLVVADGHFGVEASHALLRRLDELARHPPRDGRELLDLLQDLADLPPIEDVRAGSTLLLAALDRDAGRGVGISFGDSSLVVAGPERSATPVNRHNRNFVTPAMPASLSPARAAAFRFEAGGDDVVLVFTDGVDGCHYEHPETSVTPSRLTRIVRAAGTGPPEIARAVVRAALHGVDGYPGGQDNIALIVTRGRAHSSMPNARM